MSSVTLMPFSFASTCTVSPLGCGGVIFDLPIFNAQVPLKGLSAASKLSDNAKTVDAILNVRICILSFELRSDFGLQTAAILQDHFVVTRFSMTAFRHN